MVFLRSNSQTCSRGRLDKPGKRILACRRAPLRNFQTETYVSFRRICLHRWHRTRPSPCQYTFRMEAMAPTKQTRGGEARVVDSHNFLAAKHIAAALINVEPGGMRELHWHPNASEWQYYISGNARMTVFTTEGVRTMDFHENDVGLCRGSPAITSRTRAIRIWSF